jgi:transcriptional regulator with XRE-family HTH domain
MSLDAKLIGARIRSLRVARGLSQDALGKQIKADGPLVSLWETGKRLPSLRSRAKLAEFFKIEIEFLSGDGTERLAEVREMALTHSKKVLETGEASAAEVNAVNNVITRAVSDAEKAASAREASISQQMRGAREEFLRKLARLGLDQG